ncbi:MAG TPA: helix-turn-helix transcriptional regulator [Candidatus Limnocylindrales bacterium]|nr:helix-turn-helix transcriptional regulator [Candidatus Limnocylindrales bacterium]
MFVVFCVTVDAEARGERGTPDRAQIVAQGLPNGEIAQRLWISPGTVRRPLENAYAKLGLHTRTAAVRAALAR